MLHKERNNKEVMLKTKPNLQEHHLHKERNHKGIILKTGQRLQVPVLNKAHNPEVINLRLEIPLPEIIILRKAVTEDLNVFVTQLKHGLNDRVFFYFIFFLHIN